MQRSDSQKSSSNTSTFLRSPLRILMAAAYPRPPESVAEKTAVFSRARPDPPGSRPVRPEGRRACAWTGPDHPCGAGGRLRRPGPPLRVGSGAPRQRLFPGSRGCVRRELAGRLKAHARSWHGAPSIALPWPERVPGHQWDAQRPRETGRPPGFAEEERWAGGTRCVLNRGGVGG